MILIQKQNTHLNDINNEKHSHTDIKHAADLNTKQ